MRKKTGYQSLDLLKALARGWDEKHSLSTRENRMLLYIAQHGRQNEPGMAFAWHPMKGMTWWAEDMRMPRRALYRVLESLRERGLLADVQATETWGAKGYGIPTRVMQECVTHDTDGVSPMTHPCVMGDNHTPPLTRGNEVHNQGTKQRTKPTTYVVLAENGQERRVMDNWDQPKDEPDDFDVPKDAKIKPKRTYSPQYRLMRLFEDQWSIARCQNTSFGAAFNNQGVIMATFKRLLETLSEDDIAAMIPVFFQQAANGGVQVSGNEMWRDFLNARDEVWRIVQSSGTVSAPMETTDHNQRNIERLRKQRAAKVAT